MIHTIRKHAKWLMWLIAGLTIVSFVVFMGVGPARSGGPGYSGVNTNLIGGEIYGVKVTRELYDAMNNDVALFFLFNYGEWPSQIPSVTQDELLREIYIRMMLTEKSKQLGIHVTDAQAAQMAARMLSSAKLVHALGVNSESVPLNVFNRVLAQANMDENDFEMFIRNQLAIEQLQQIIGLPGQLITPQEAATEYVRENQEFSAQIIFFSASNYLDQIMVNPEDVRLYYTNYMADYRLPDRRQVSYVLFSVTNYLGQALKEISSSNLDMEVENAYDKYGTNATPGASTPEEAKLDLRKIILRQQALQNAVTQADNFAQSVFNVSNSGNKPASSEDLFTIARQQGLKVETVAPFSADYGPSEFPAPAAFTETAFELSPDSPISEPIPSLNGVYVIALDKILPSEIPPLAEIRARVTEDLRLREATVMAQRDGTNFASRLMGQMAAGKSFAAAGVADGLEPEVLPPFSLSTQELPELDDHATIGQLRAAAFTTPVGTASRFVETTDGGFVLYIASRLPIDKSQMAADLPQFTAEFRGRSSMDAFEQWLQTEASRELRDTPLVRQMGAR